MVLEQGVIANPDVPASNQADLKQAFSESRHLFSRDVPLRDLVPGFFARRSFPKEIRRSTAEINITDGSEAVFFDVRLPGVSGKSFFKVLVSGSHSLYDTIGGARADWDILLERVREEDAGKNGLYLGHMGMEQFAEFEANHFDNFWRMLNVLNEKGTRKKLSQKPDFVGPDWWKDNEDMIKKIVSGRKGIFRYGPTNFNWLNIFLDRKNGLVKDFPDLRAQLYTTIRAFGLYDKKPPFTAEDAKDDKMPEIFRSFFANLDKVVITAYEARAVDEFVVIRDTDPIGKVYQRQRTGVFGNELTTTTEKVGDNRIKVSYFNSHQVHELQKPGGHGSYQSVVVEESIVKETSVSPRVIWARDKLTGERQYMCLAMDDNSDLLLGKIFVIAASGDIKDKQLPRRLGFEPFGRLMEIGANQIPATSGYFDQAFLNSSGFIKRVEDLTPNLR